MEQLHFVGFTNDNEALMLSRRDDATSGEYFVAIDEYLLAAIEQFDGEGDDADDRQVDARASLALPRGSLPAPAPMYPRPSSELSPREIQSRLRSGSSISDVADEAGVDEEWIVRFAAPIIAEQARVVQQAQGLTFTKPRVGPSSQPLRTSVRWNLADQGSLRDDELFDAGWSAYNLQGARWVVRLNFVAKRRRKMAEWEVDLREGELLARNRVATDLGYVEPGRRRKRSDSELSPPAPAGRSNRGSAKKATKAIKATKKKALAPRVARAGMKKVGAKRPSAKVVKTSRNATPRKAAAAKATPRKVAPRKATPRKVAPRKATARKATARRATARRATARRATARRATARKAPSEGPPAPTASKQASYVARHRSPLTRADRAFDGPPAVTAVQGLSPGSDPAVAPPEPERSPPPEPEPAPVSEVEPLPSRPPLVIMSTPDVTAGVPLTERDLADESSRWPLPRRRR